MSTSPSRLTTQKEDGANPFDLLVAVAQECGRTEASLRLSATLLLVEQLLYVVVTLFHTGGEANHHSAIFAAYADSGI